MAQQQNFATNTAPALIDTESLPAELQSSCAQLRELDTRAAALEVAAAATLAEHLQTVAAERRRGGQQAEARPRDDRFDAQWGEISGLCEDKARRKRVSCKLSVTATNAIRRTPPGINAGGVIGRSIARWCALRCRDWLVGCQVVCATAQQCRSAIAHRCSQDEPRC